MAHIPILEGAGRAHGNTAAMIRAFYGHSESQWE